jgi:hypothetical protein
MKQEWEGTASHHHHQFNIGSCIQKHDRLKFCFSSFFNNDFVFEETHISYTIHSLVPHFLVENHLTDSVGSCSTKRDQIDERIIIASAKCPSAKWLSIKK